MFGGPPSSDLKAEKRQPIEEYWDKSTSHEIFNIIKYRKTLRKIQRYNVMSNRIESVKNIYTEIKQKKRMN